MSLPQRRADHDYLVGPPFTKKNRSSNVRYLARSYCALDAAHRWAVGAAIMKTEGNGRWSAPPAVLILKRVSHDTSFPGLWEIPVGNVEACDDRVDAALRRQVMEKTNLVVEKIVGGLQEMRWSGKRNSFVQLNYVVSTEQPQKIALNPEEHTKCAWATADQLDKVALMSAEMRAVVMEALEIAQGPSGIGTGPKNFPAIRFASAENLLHNKTADN